MKNTFDVNIFKSFSVQENLDLFCKLLKDTISKEAFCRQGIDCDIILSIKKNTSINSIMQYKFEGFWENNKYNAHYGFILSVFYDGEYSEDFLYQDVLTTLYKTYLREIKINEILEN